MGHFVLHKVSIQVFLTTIWIILARNTGLWRGGEKNEGKLSLVSQHRQKSPWTRKIFLQMEQWLNFFPVRRVTICYEMTWNTCTMLNRIRMELWLIPNVWKSLLDSVLGPPPWSGLFKNSHNHTHNCWRIQPERRKKFLSGWWPQLAALRGLRS